jgi:hypothetical protein
MALADEQLDTANACHDDDPQRGADLLRGIDPAAIDSRRRPLLASLLNHVFGEIQARWDEAWALQRRLLATEPQPGIALLRHAAVAAAQAGDADAAASFTTRLAAAAGGRPDAAQALVALSVAGFTAPPLDAAGAAATTLRALQGLDALHDRPAPGLDAAFGAVTNNLASHLAERTIADLGDPELARALRETAAHSQRFWQRAGQWLQHERAHYLAALAANALGDAESAAHQARAGLVLLDTHDTAREETVDRAFLEQELAQALSGSGPGADPAGAQAASARAQAIVAAWQDQGLRKSFAEREARNALLRARGP